MKHVSCLVATTALALGAIAAPVRADVPGPRAAPQPWGDSAAEPRSERPRGGVAPDDATAARVLFAEGRRLAGQGHYFEACPKFEESQRLEPNVGTAFALADCYEHAERGATAWMLFLDVATRARASGQLPREAAARARATALEPKLSRIVIMVPPSADLQGLEIRRDGRLVGRAQWGMAIYVDGGSHEIEANAPSRQRWAATPFVKGMADTVIVTVPVLEVETAPPSPPPEPAQVEPPPPRPRRPPPTVHPVPAPEPASSAPPAPPPPRASPAPRPAATPAATASAAPTTPVGSPPQPPQPAGTSSTLAVEDSPPGQTQRIIGASVAGVGVLGLGLGAYFYFVGAGKASDAEAFCQGAVCKDPRGLQLRDEASSDAITGLIVGLLGVSAAATGAVLYFTAPSAGPPTAKAALNVRFGPRSVAIGGVW